MGDDEQMDLLAVTVFGPDRPGIVAETTAALAAAGGNIQDSTMTLLGGHFAMLLLVSAPGGPDGAGAALAGLTDDGRLSVDVRVVPATGEVNDPVAGDPYLLSVHGADRPGIVSALTSVVARAGGNVDDLTTRLVGGLYVLVAEVRMPASAEVGRVEAELRRTAEELGVDVSLRRVEVDDL
jgi:glycine cleavage system transcriptional repressor